MTLADRPVLRSLSRAPQLFALALAVLAGHEATARLLAAGVGPRAAGLASVAASAAVWLLYGIFLLPRLRTQAARVVLATTLAAVALRAAVEAFGGGLVGGLPLASMAAVIAFAGGGAALMPLRVDARLAPERRLEAPVLGLPRPSRRAS